jgi:hypothetical protein
MTKPLPFTEAAIRRAVAGARKSGIQVNAVRISPDGSVTVLQDLAAAPASGENPAQSKWLDVEA